MPEKQLVAKRINNGQSEIWVKEHPKNRRLVATNGILFPIRTSCATEEIASFLAAFADGDANIPGPVTAKLVEDFSLQSD